MKITSEQEMIKFGEEFATSLLKPNSPSVIELIGDVGAGKTTFVRGLAKGLGIKEPITSPSFTISKSYALPNNRYLVHYDFYRLGDPGLMVENFYENISNSNNIVLIEWGESVKNLLPDNHIAITINYNDDNTRKVKIK
ncbi:tRNA (adenosine(37)-N6)-threonylcarbamoyltransferase complex ATPase subunit type 1 TsaE [Candidatus Saccharibacteria bacterium]|nr:tRNA (adenosine(37)-N6)-threonylcarbamoyltransferase complex ATPase subunit type 1 TsaE [Candidatus Saccharibacteria bacterium]